MKKLIVLLSATFLFSYSCKSEEVIIYDSEKQGYERLIQAYDSYVFSRTDKNLTIAEAYYNFFDLNVGKIQSMGDIGDYYAPDSVFFYKLAIDFLNKEIDIPFLYPGITTEHRKNKDIKSYPTTMLNVKRLGEFISGIEKENEIWAGTAESFEAMGDFSPTILAGIASSDNYKNYNLDNKDERFLIAVIFFKLFIQANFTYTLNWTPNDN